MQPMKFFLDTHDSRSETFPAGITRAKLAEFFPDYEKACREEGVVVVRLHVGFDEGRAFCLTMAPSAEAVRRAHARAGLAFDSEPAFREFVFEVLSRRVFELMVALEETGSLRVEQRIAAFLLRRAGEGDIVRITQERLAAHLGSAREVVFRALRSLVASGCVDTRRGAIRIVDRKRLASIVHDVP